MIKSIVMHHADVLIWLRMLRITIFQMMELCILPRVGLLGVGVCECLVLYACHDENCNGELRGQTHADFQAQ